MTNTALAALLQRVADLLAFTEAPDYAVSAYRKAARTLTKIPDDVQALWQHDQLARLPDMTPMIMTALDEVLRTGHLGLLAQLEASVPSELPSLFMLARIDPQTARILYNALRIKSFSDLERAIDADMLAGVKGLGKAKHNSLGWIPRSVHSAAALNGNYPRNLLGSAWPAAQQLRAAVATLPNSTIQRVAVIGDIARGRETVVDILLLAAAEDPGRAIDAFSHMAEIGYIYGQQTAPNNRRVSLRNGFTATLLAVPPRRWALAYVWNTADTAHRTLLTTRAEALGYTIRAEGLVRDGVVRRVLTEADVYEALGLPFIPVEQRKGETVPAGLVDRADRAVITRADLRGDLHTHSAWSDGTTSIEAMAFAAAQRGDAYLLVSDHNQGAGTRRGLDARTILEQRREIDGVNTALARAGFGLQVLQGCEVDIEEDGSLALDAATLAHCDIVVAALHHSIDQPRARVTARVIRAMHNRAVHILAHPTGRLLTIHPGADLDMEQVVRVAAETGVVLEINSMPERLDMRDTHIELAVEAGCRVSIGSDAHAPWQLDWAELGILTARRAALTPDRVVNAQPDADHLRTVLRRS